MRYDVTRIVPIALVSALVLGLACVGLDGARPAPASAAPAPDGAEALPLDTSPAAAPYEERLPWPPADVAPLASETHLASLRQLTHGGSNAEAYFRPDGRALILQATRGPYACDQIFTLDLETGLLRRVSTGTGRTTCAYYYEGGERILFASTHAASPECPPRPDRSEGYMWSIHSTYDIYTARADGSDRRRLTDVRGYDAEATVAPDGRTIVFTSTRDGDLDLYTMQVDGTGVRRITTRKGYDGGAFFSPDGEWLVFRGLYPRNDEEEAEYDRLLARDLLRPRHAEIVVMRPDGSEARAITNNGAANFAPSFFPDGRRIIFASNLHAPNTGHFSLYAIGIDGTGLERITWTDGFDAFPVFSPDGRTLCFISDRGATAPHQFDVFLAVWRG